MKALVLAAGKSTRIAGVSAGLPKPLIPVDGEPILAHTLRWLSAYGVTDIWINLHFQPETIRQFVGDGCAWGVRVSYSEEPEILGTAGAVKKLEKEWTEDFLVVYGDNLLGFDLRRMRETHARSAALGTIAVYDWTRDAHSGIAGGRVALDADGRVAGFQEGRGEGEGLSKWVNAGVYLFRPEICEDIPLNTFCDFGRDVFPALMKEGRRLQAFPIGGYCLAADTPEALARTESLIAGGRVRLAGG